ncbi:Mth938-like domain-containing protein [Varunaivibrio sulfuroxidans]|uniref:Mth938-like domain-containing protein n=1 Tax=Varunaivibrio sulfuroxidans TaxID=1773489 RepID=UPI0023E33E47|nr:Mth938-like domain-containing protein [Varunaivibrio sulfuroxidans]WES32248.1 Mth938-like domain-containing protein [Varunaivibrio sulfuroxidans]
MVQGYGEGEFRISERDYAGSVFICERETVLWPKAERILGAGQGFDPADLDDILQYKNEIDILVFGCGARFVLPNTALHAFLGRNAIALEWMATGAACRTYNILAIEGRRVAGVFIAVE